MNGGKACCRAMGGAGGAVLLLCPRLILVIFAGAAEKASVLRSPCFIPGPVEEWNVSTTDGLVLFEDVEFSSLKAAAPGW